MVNNIIIMKRVVIICITVLFAIVTNAQEAVNVKLCIEDSVLLKRATCYRYGINTDVNPNKALNIYKYLSRRGNVDAMICLGEMFQSGDGVEINNRIAYNLYKRAAKEGNSNAMCKLAKMYQFGIGIKQNFSKAFYYYSKAATLKSSQGYYGAGYLLYKGLGTKQDYLKAEKLLKKGSDLKHPGCAFLLASYYSSDYGKLPDYEEAKKYYDRALKCGHAWTVDLTKYKTLDSIVMRNSTRPKIAAGIKWKNKLKWSPDSELSYVSVDSLCGNWIGKVYVYDWSGITVTDEETVEFRIIRCGDYFQMEWLRNDTVCVKFQPDKIEDNVWKCTHIDRDYVEKYPWAISKLKFGLTKDNQLCANIRRVDVRQKEPMRPVVAILNKSQDHTFGHLFKIERVHQMSCDNIQIAISSKVSTEITISFYNMSGTKLVSCESQHINAGMNIVSVNTNIGKGKYVLSISSNNCTESVNLAY